MASRYGDSPARFMRSRYPASTTDPDPELDELVTMLEAAGLAERYINEDGKDAIRLTARGAALGRAMAMGGDMAGAEAMLDALIDAEVGDPDQG